MDEWIEASTKKTLEFQPFQISRSSRLDPFNRINPIRCTEKDSKSF